VVVAVVLTQIILAAVEDLEEVLEVLVEQFLQEDLHLEVALEMSMVLLMEIVVEVLHKQEAVLLQMLLVAVVQGAEVLTYLVDQVTVDLEDLVEFQI
tara:strand:+ start:167 stop:457 length:291 start_codon:yes stop_codon:yes gene_type:complete